jgi:hypothetical protein
MIDFRDIQNSAGLIRKFGRNPDIDTTTDPEDVWEFGGLYTFPDNSGEQMYVSSSNGSDTEILLIDGLDSNFNRKTVVIQLSGQTKTLVPDGVFSRVFRSYTDNATELQGDVYIYTDSDVSLGVPDTASAVKAVVSPENQQTLMSIYTIPAGYHGWIVEIYGICSKVAGVSNPAADMKLMIREYSKTLRTQYTCEFTDALYKDDFSIPLIVPEKTDILWRAQTTKDNNTTVNAGFSLSLRRC